MTKKKPTPKSNIVPFERDPDFYFRLAIKRAVDRSYPEALKYIDAAIDLDAYNADYLFNKACILVELRRVRESIKLLNYVVCKIDPTYTECYFGLGCNYFDTGDYDRSLHYFEKYVMLEEEGEFRDEAFEILFYMRLNGDEATDDGQPCINEFAQKQYLDSSRKLYTVGSMYFQRGNYKEAIRQFERSIMACPETMSSRIRLSMAYYMTGQLPMAKVLASSVLKMQRNHRMAKLCLALYYSVDGQQDMTERLLALFARMRGKKRGGSQVEEDGAFYERMLKIAPVEDELKSRLEGVVRKLYAP